MRWVIVVAVVMGAVGCGEDPDRPFCYPADARCNGQVLEACVLVTATGQLGWQPVADCATDGAVCGPTASGLIGCEPAAARAP